jgi:hypothetical protein
MSLDHHFAEPTAIRTNLGAIFVSLELGRSTWLITSLSPGGGEKMSKHGLSVGNIAALYLLSRHHNSPIARAAHRSEAQADEPATVQATKSTDDLA